MADRGFDLLGGLRRRARKAVADNAGLLNISGRRMSLEDRASRFYDLDAKRAVAERIAAEELDRAAGSHNDIGDAMRHARWSKRTAEATGPMFAEAAGIAHEFENLRDSLGFHGAPPYRPGGRPTPGQTVDEIRMDLRNNAEGRAAAREGREIDPGRLQTSPVTPRFAPLYRSPPAGRTTSAPR